MIESWQGQNTSHFQKPNKKAMLHMLLDLYLSKIPNSISMLVGIWFIPRITENLLEMKHYCANLHTAYRLFTTANCKLRPYQFDALFLGQTRAENRPTWSAWKLINKRCGLANCEYHQSTDSQLTVRPYQVNYFVSQIRRVCFSKKLTFLTLWLERVLLTCYWL